MKQLYTLLIAVILTASALAQAPEKMSYQAVIRNSSDALVRNTQIGMQISILQGSASGTVVYTETQTAGTNTNGLVSIEIGGGAGFSTIDWANDIFFIKTATDPTGGSNYTIIGTSQLTSVPYALYAKTSGSSTAWSRLGDSGTVDGINFIGTTDNVPFNIRVNNKQAGRIDGTLGNTFFGYLSGNSNTTGNNNTANGTLALYSNTTGSFNTANGTLALYSNTTGSNNTANGRGALLDNTTGIENTANGSLALRANTTGNWNTANGYGALYSNTVGYSNVANGFYALHSNVSGFYNTATGVNALRFNLTGEQNTAIGHDALRFNTNGYDNTATGNRALYSNITGSRNTANGTGALYSSVGFYNTASGYEALYSNTTGSRNTANGYMALYSNTTGYSNTANGNYALFSNTTGVYNSACGDDALRDNTTGSYNTASGEEALSSNTSGSSNTAIGYSAFSFTVGNNTTNSTALGHNAEPGASNTIRLGNSSVATIGGYANWSNVSDGRFKVDVQENVAGLEFIKKLRPVTYHLDMEAIARFNNTPDSLRLPESEQLKAAELQVGFIAQEVESAAQALNFNFHGVDVPKNETSHYGLRYAEFVVPLVKAIQEQQEMIEELMNQNVEMKKEIEAIKSNLK